MAILEGVTPSESVKVMHFSLAIAKIWPIISHNCKRCNLVLITNRKSYVSFRLVLKSVTLNDLERRNGRYIALFYWIWQICVATHKRNDLWRNLCTSLLYFVVRVLRRRKESSRSLSHLLMSFLSLTEGRRGSPCSRNALFSMRRFQCAFMTVNDAESLFFCRTPTPTSGLEHLGL